MNKRVKNKICKVACTSEDTPRVAQSLKKRYAIQTFKWQKGKDTHIMCWLKYLGCWCRFTRINDGTDNLNSNTLWELIPRTLWQLQCFPQEPYGNYNRRPECLSKYQINK